MRGEASLALRTGSGGPTAAATTAVTGKHVMSAVAAALSPPHLQIRNLPRQDLLPLIRRSTLQGGQGPQRGALSNRPHTGPW